jgi:hypothetical protein
MALRLAPHTGEKKNIAKKNICTLCEDRGGGGGERERERERREYIITHNKKKEGIRQSGENGGIRGMT